MYLITLGCFNNNIDVEIIIDNANMAELVR